jgi:hypothetical protein
VLDLALQRQVPFATKLMLDALALGVKTEQEREIRRVFDRPTPYTQRSVFLQRATKRRLQARVWVKDDLAGAPDTNYLDSQVFGGPRRMKRFERALQRAGVLPAGWYAVPGDAAQRDGYGNMTRAQLVQIVAFFDAFGQQGYRANLGDRGRERLRRGTRGRVAKEFFVAVPGIRQTAHMTPGVYEAVFTAFGRATPRPVLIFVRNVAYRKRLDFEGVARRYIARNAERAWADAWAEAVRTAR